jgi:hypothetical protein
MMSQDDRKMWSTDDTIAAIDVEFDNRWGVFAT